MGMRRWKTLPWQLRARDARHGRGVRPLAVTGGTRALLADRHRVLRPRLGGRAVALVAGGALRGGYAAAGVRLGVTRRALLEAGARDDLVVELGRVRVARLAGHGAGVLLIPDVAAGARVRVGVRVVHLLLFEDAAGTVTARAGLAAERGRRVALRAGSRLRRDVHAGVAGRARGRHPVVVRLLGGEGAVVARRTVVEGDRLSLPW